MLAFNKHLEIIYGKYLWENTEVDNTGTKQDSIKSGCESLLNRKTVSILTYGVQTVHAQRPTV